MLRGGVGCTSITRHYDISRRREVLIEKKNVLKYNKYIQIHRSFLDNDYNYDSNIIICAREITICQFCFTLGGAQPQVLQSGNICSPYPRRQHIKQ